MHAGKAKSKIAIVISPNHFLKLKLMLSKGSIKFINSLRKKKYRQKYNKFVVEGEKIAIEVINSSCNIHSIYTTEEFLNKIPISQKAKLARIELVTNSELQKVSSLSTANEVLIICEIPNPLVDPTIVETDFALYLDDINDPGNLGTIWRIADWFGFPYVFCSLQTVDPYNEKVIQSSMGSFLRVPIIRTNALELFEQFPNMKVYGTTMDAKNVFETGPLDPGFVLIGSESHGLKKELLDRADINLAIPKHHEGPESLNAGVSAGIICASLRNQK